MATSLSEALGLRVIEAVEVGASRRQAAALFGVSVSSAIRWVAEWRASGRTAARRPGGDRKSRRIEAEAGFLLAQVKQTPDITLAELQAQLRERSVPVSISTIWRVFARHRVTFKKRRRMLPSKSGLIPGCTDQNPSLEAPPPRPPSRGLDRPCDA
jgi:transposase